MEKIEVSKKKRVRVKTTVPCCGRAIRFNLLPAVEKEVRKFYCDYCNKAWPTIVITKLSEREDLMIHKIEWSDE